MAAEAQNYAPISMGLAIRSLKTQMRAQWLTGERRGAAPLLLGAPGASKTMSIIASAREVARNLNRSVGIFVVTLIDREVPDLRGMALPVKGPDGVYRAIHYTRSGILPAIEVEEEFDQVLLLIDEVPAATMDHIKSVAAVFLDYECGNTKLDPSKYFVCGAGNGTEHRSGAARLPAHFINRVALRHVQPDVEHVMKYFQSRESGMPPAAATFVQFRPALFQSASVPDAPNTPFLTFRSFEAGIKSMMVEYAEDPTDVDPYNLSIFDAAFASSETAAEATTLLSGYIGVGAAREFVQFAKVRHQLTSLRDILRDPERASLPTQPDALFAQSSYVVAWTEGRTKAELSAMLTYVGRLRADLRVPTLIRMLEVTDGKLAAVAGYGQLVAQNAGLAQATAAAGAR